jgi:hypothetical protein
MNIKAGDPKPTPPLVELAALRPTWVSFLGTGESEVVNPAGLASYPDGAKLILIKIKTVTDEGAPEEIGRIEVSEADIVAGKRWAAEARGRLFGGAYVSDADREPFYKAMDGIDNTDAYTTSAVAAFLSEGTVTVRAIRPGGDVSPYRLVELVRARDSGDGTTQTDELTITSGRSLRVKFMARELEEAPPPTLERNLHTVEEAVDLDHQMARETYLGL